MSLKSLWEQNPLLGRWSWLWVIVPREYLVRGLFVRPWWMGSVGELRGHAQDTVTFAVVPVNLIVDLAVKFYRWAVFRVPGMASRETENAYRRGLVDGRAQERATMRTRLQRLDEVAMNTGRRWWQAGGGQPVAEKATDLLRDEE